MIPDPLLRFPRTKEIVNSKVWSFPPFLFWIGEAINQRYSMIYWCKNWAVLLVRMHLGHYLWKTFSVDSAWSFSVTFYRTWFQVLVKSEDHTLMTHAFIISAIMFIYKHHNCVWKIPHKNYETRIDCTVLHTKFKFCPLNIINMIHQTEFC